MDAITWAMIKAEVVCGNSGSNGVRTFTETRRSWEKYFASMIVRCTLGKGIRGGQDPGVDRDQQARRRDLINIISYLHFYIVTNTLTIYSEVNIISSLHYSCLLNEFSDIITIEVLPVRIPHAEATT